MKLRVVGILIISTVLLTENNTYSQGCSFEIESEVKVECHDASDGRITVNVNGAAEPYKIEWENGSQSLYRVNLTKGTYTVTITDADGCQKSKNIQVPGSGEIDIDWKQISIDDQMSSIQILSEKGEKPIEYFWYDLQNGVLYETKSLNNVESKKFSLVLKDGNGCIKTFSIDLN